LIPSRAVPVFLSFALLAAGCAALPGAPPGPGVLTGAAPETLRAEAVVELVGSTDGPGRATGEGATVRGRALVLAERPGSFRIEVYGPFSEVSALFVSDGEALMVAARGDSRLYTWGEPLFPYPFSAEEAVFFLMGCPAVAEGAQRCGGPRYEVTRGADGVIAGVHGPSNGSGRFEVAFSDFRDVSGFMVPYSITISLGGEDLRIRYSAIELNAAITPGYFRINSDG
jgi:hypothetical protein